MVNPNGVAIGDQLMLEKVVGRALPAALFTFEPWGNRIVVARQAPPGKHVVTRDDGTKTEIVLLEEYQTLPTVGWIVSMGPDAFPGEGLPLLGAKVIFGQHAGRTLLVGDRTENLYESLYTILLDIDVWGRIIDKETP